MKKIILTAVSLALSSSLFANQGLVEAEILTGLQYYPQKNTASESTQSNFSVVASLKQKTGECIAYGSMDGQAGDKALLRLHAARCGDLHYKIDGVFFDREKQLGAEQINLPHKNGLIEISPQKGYVYITHTELIKNK